MIPEASDPRDYFFGILVYTPRRTTYRKYGTVATLRNSTGMTKSCGCGECGREAEVKA